MTKHEETEAMAQRKRKTAKVLGYPFCRQCQVVTVECAGERCPACASGPELPMSPEAAIAVTRRSGLGVYPWVGVLIAGYESLKSQLTTNEARGETLPGNGLTMKQAMQARAAEQCRIGALLVEAMCEAKSNVIRDFVEPLLPRIAPAIAAPPTRDRIMTIDEAVAILRDSREMFGFMRTDGEVALDTLLAAYAAQAADSKRLDWLDRAGRADAEAMALIDTGPSGWTFSGRDVSSLREAIDDALSGTKTPAL